MRLRTVLILLILVVGLVAFIELYEHELPSTEERAVLGKRVLGVDELEAQNLEIAWDENLVRLEADPAPADRAWRLTEPLAARADENLVAALLDGLASLEKRRTLEDTARADVGLEPPRLTATLMTTKGSTRLEVGSEVPGSDSMIIAVDGGNEIFVVENTLWPDLTREPGDWRSRKVFHGGQSDIQRVSLTRGGEEIAVTRRDKAFWIESPFVDWADSDRVDELLSQLASMQITSFVDEPGENTAELGLDPAVGELEIDLGEGSEPFRLAWGEVVGAEKNLHFAVADGQLFTTDSELQKFFDTPVEGWRSLALTSMETFQIDAMEIFEEGQDELTLTRAGADWNRGEEEISFTSVSELLYAVTGARAQEAMADSGAAISSESSPEPVLRLVLRGGEMEQTVAFYRGPDKDVLARVGNRQVGLKVGQNEFTEILDKLGQVRAANSKKTVPDEQQPADETELSSDQES